AFGLDRIHSEYGMTELLSQAYSSGDGWFRPAPTMRVAIRDMTDPLQLLPVQERLGAINVVDLANLDTCSFVATEDLGRLRSDDAFEVLGRMDNSDLRGCNLLLEER
ncbi:MAG: acyl transferase, partial [Saprospiraceae bacterium]|nr:acyl transferase [Saprospiraceae bacterium]